MRILLGMEEEFVQDVVRGKRTVREWSGPAPITRNASRSNPKFPSSS